VEEDAAVAAGGQHHRVSRGDADPSGHQVAHHHSLGAAVRDDQVQHLVAGVQLHRAAFHLAQQGLRTGDLELLAGLASRVVGAGNLHTSEGAGGELPAVFTGERGADGVHVVDHPHRFLGQTPHVGLPAPEVAALDGVRDEPGQRVTVHLPGTGGVDAALGGDAVRTAGCVVEGEALHLVAQLPQRRGHAGPGQPGSDHDHGVLLAVGRAHQFVLGLAAFPCGAGVTFGEVGIEHPGGQHLHGAWPVGRRGHAITPSSTRRGIMALPSTTARASRPPMATQTCLNRRPVTPRSCSRVRQPCSMWKPITSITTM